MHLDLLVWRVRRTFLSELRGAQAYLVPASLCYLGEYDFGVFDLKLGFQQSNSGLAWCVLLLKMIIILEVKILWTQRCSGVSW